MTDWLWREGDVKCNQPTRRLLGVVGYIGVSVQSLAPMAFLLSYFLGFAPFSFASNLGTHFSEM